MPPRARLPINLLRVLAVPGAVVIAFSAPWWRTAPGTRVTTLVAGGEVLLCAGVALALLRPRSRRLRVTGGLPCPGGCGARWLVVDEAEAFRVYGYLDFRGPPSAWVECPGTASEEPHAVSIDWDVARAEMRAALEVQSHAPDESSARAAALLRDGSVSLSGSPLLQTYTQELALYAPAPWPSGAAKLDALHRLMAALTLWENDRRRTARSPASVPPFDVALSFAGEDRPYVVQVARALEAANVRVFYDHDQRATLSGKDLYEYLTDVYSTATYTVLFVSRHYHRKLWTNHERRVAQQVAFHTHRENIIPARFDDTPLPGIRPSTGYVDLRECTPSQLVALIREKLGRA